MNERSMATDRAAQQSAEDYIRSVPSAAVSLAAEIAGAKNLLDAWATNQAEYEQPKVHALA